MYVNVGNKIQETTLIWSMNMSMNKLLLFMSFLIFISLLASGQIDRYKGKKQVKRTILFVCEHGAIRSAIAASYFNKSAEKLGL